MRKLFSAVTSLAVAATMVGAVAPMAVGAADASKGFAIRTYENAALPDGVTASGSTVTVSADAIAAGDVVVPCGVYLIESTNDAQTLSVQATVSSDNADVSGIKFEYFDATADYFDAAQTFTLAGGTEASSTKPITFAGTWNTRFKSFSAAGASNIVAAENQVKAGTDNAYLGIAWTNNGSAYTWAGDKSDDFPIVVFNVTIPKGTAAGDYDLKFLNYDIDEEHGIPSCMVETASGRYANLLGLTNLTLDELKITVEGDVVTTTSTTTATTTGTTTTTTTTSATQSSATTTTSTTKPVSNADIIIDFTNKESEDGKYHVNAGDKEVYVDAYINSNNNTIAGIAMAVDYDKSVLQLDDILNQCFAAGGATMYVNVAEGELNGSTTDKNSDPALFDDSQIFLDYTFSVLPDAADGEYEVSLSKNIVLKDGQNNQYSVQVIPGIVVVGEGGTTTTTTSTAATTTTTTTTTASTTSTTASTSASTTSTIASASSSTTTTTQTTTTTATSTTGTTTTTTKKVGDPDWGDANCDGTVNVADVVVLNKWLNDSKSYNLTDQGKLNADCYNPKNGTEITAEDSDAIIKSIVHLETLPVNK